jgi:glutamate dehydrogenase
VDGAALRVKVVGEGGNLGLTQRGRIEFARNGGKINTDALDNSAGVDCSDHEVNIKIMLDELIAHGRLDGEHRNHLLAAMTDEVGDLVLRDNYAQNAMLGVSRAHAGAMCSVHARLVGDLEERASLDRELEALPSARRFREMDKEGLGLTSPELASLMAHVKLAVKHDVLDSELPDAEVFARRLPEYFPAELRERYGAAISHHPLRREITTTLLVNEMVDGAGISYAFRLSEELAASATDAVRAYAAVTRIYDLPALWAEIERLDNVVPTDAAAGLVLETRRLLDRASRWLLTNRPQPLAVGAEINRFSPIVAELAPRAVSLLRGSERAAATSWANHYVERGVPRDLAERVGALLHTYCLLDVREAAEMAEQESAVATERSNEETAELYFALSEHLKVDSLLTSVSSLERGNRWHALARLALRDDLYSSLRAITMDVLRHSDPEESAELKISKWEESNASRLSRARQALGEIERARGLDLATLSVAARQVRSMVR